MKAQIDQIRVGKVQVFGPKGEPSAYRKQEIAGPVAVDSFGIVGDEQADRQHHGGVDKAILHYARDHYADWLVEQPELAKHLGEPGAFGENLSTLDVSEDRVCVGDRFSMGTVVLEVSQGRQPCWKLGHRFGAPAMVREVLRTGRGGWYYRVLQAGQVRAGDSIELIGRPYPEWTVLTVTRLLLTGGHDPKALSALAELPVLSANWRARARRKLENLARRQHDGREQPKHRTADWRDTSD